MRSTAVERLRLAERLRIAPLLALSWVEVLGFGVWSLGFGVWSLGFGVEAVLAQMRRLFVRVGF